jgi:anti-sigma factor RsiW
MNRDFELKLQAHLDGELGAGEAAEVEARLQTDPQAQTLRAELGTTAGYLRGNEPEYRLAETREFYWSKIERAILGLEPAHAHHSSVSLMDWLRRYWPQLTGACTAALLLLAAAWQFGWIAPRSWVEAESSVEDMGAVAFRSEAERMTVVYLYDRSSSQEAPDEENPDSIN